jgi:hypothetical protein
VRAFVFATITVALGCEAAAPTFFEMRIRSVPPREAGCALEWLRQVPDDVKGPIGTVSLTRGVPGDDPLGASARALVGPRACAMGGHTVALFTVAVLDARPVSATYLVLPGAQGSGQP